MLHKDGDMKDKRTFSKDCLGLPEEPVTWVAGERILTAEVAERLFGTIPITRDVQKKYQGYAEQVLAAHNTRFGVQPNVTVYSEDDLHKVVVSGPCVVAPEEQATPTMSKPITGRMVLWNGAGSAISGQSTGTFTGVSPMSQLQRQNAALAEQNYNLQRDVLARQETIDTLRSELDAKNKAMSQMFAPKPMSAEEIQKAGLSLYQQWKSRQIAKKEQGE